MKYIFIFTSLILSSSLLAQNSYSLIGTWEFNSLLKLKGKSIQYSGKSTFKKGGQAIDYLLPNYKRADYEWVIKQNTLICTLNGQKSYSKIIWLNENSFKQIFQDGDFSGQEIICNRKISSNDDNKICPDCLGKKKLKCGRCIDGDWWDDNLKKYRGCPYCDNSSGYKICSRCNGKGTIGF